MIENAAGATRPERYDPLEWIMSSEEAAKKWGLSPGTVKNMCRTGRIKAKKVGPTWVIDINTPNPI